MNYQVSQSGERLVVPTSETLKQEFFLKLAIKHEFPLALVGNIFLIFLSLNPFVDFFHCFLTFLVKLFLFFFKSLDPSIAFYTVCQRSVPPAPERPSSPAASSPVSPPRSSSTTSSTSPRGPTSTTPRTWSCPSWTDGGRECMVRRWAKNASFSSTTWICRRKMRAEQFHLSSF